MTNLWNFMEEREHVDFPMFLELGNFKRKVVLLAIRCLALKLK